MNHYLSLSCFLAIFICIGCANQSTKPSLESRDQVFKTTLSGLRLGDGVPIGIEVSVRWQIEDMITFNAQFAAPQTYDSLILRPRELEVATHICNRYLSVDSVFTTQRKPFIEDIKNTFKSSLGEKSISIKEVIVSNLFFPNSYTKAWEEVGTQNRELERIKKRNIMDLTQAEADKKKAVADGGVAITQAKQEGELEKIRARTEESRRKNELARAETQRLVDEKLSKAEARKIELLAKAEVDKKRELQNLEVDKLRQIQHVEVEKIELIDKAEHKKQIELARLCIENPTYASFLVNKELAGKVKIAVLPSSSNVNFLGDMLKSADSDD